ncbi:hypothetical protein KAW18_01810 [candidate division WOR-3 bacterium]|nr:hypothetical protein [candidate division WOR-3 bacterium]
MRPTLKDRIKELKDVERAIDTLRKIRNNDKRVYEVIKAGREIKRLQIQKKNLESWIAKRRTKGEKE